MMRKTWTPPAAAGPYLHDIYTTEDRLGMPRNLLARLIYQESRYRPEIISGELQSGAGAQGIAQIIPRWHPDVDPLNPYQSITYAGEYLAQLKRQFGTWEQALAAYNWGPGNLTRKGLDNAPKETRDYLAGILGDVPAARGQA